MAGDMKIATHTHIGPGVLPLGKHRTNPTFGFPSIRKKNSGFSNSKTRNRIDTGIF
jgi:hypothetical protein